MNSKLWSCLTHNHIDFHSRFHVTWSYSMQEANNESWDIDKAGSLDVRAGVGSGCFSVESFSPMIAEAHSHCEQPKWASRLGTSIHNARWSIWDSHKKMQTWLRLGECDMVVTFWIKQCLLDQVIILSTEITMKSHYDTFFHQRKLPPSSLNFREWW